MIAAVDEDSAWVVGGVWRVGLGASAVGRRLMFGSGLTVSIVRETRALHALHILHALHTLHAYVTHVTGDARREARSQFKPLLLVDSNEWIGPSVR